ncbi:apolipoprotein N-acyltransferase [Chitinibacter sp. SCUT-21]|uniref:apolipoprotein N-acyltransferase n=1 Tax=Chitinibacter sp. SCUT-21 TaxID=2970891 RepID=UPI0035A6F94B
MQLNRIQQLALQALFGTLSVLAFAPASQFWLMPICLWVFLLGIQQAKSARWAALNGFTWGLGYFCANASWVYISLHTHGGMPIWMAAGSTLGFAIFLALFPMLAAFFTRKLIRNASRRLEALRYALLAPTLFVIFEWVRGWIFTGFPWGSVGGSQLATMSGFYPIIGSYGVGFLLCLAVGVFVYEKRLGLGVVLALISTGSLLNQIDWTKPQGEPVKVSLLQGNIPQSIKWNPDVFVDSLGNYMELAQRAQGQLVVFPETAIPSTLDNIPDWYLDDLRQVMRDKKAEAILGVAVGDAQNRLFNAAINLAQPTQTPYAKYHLVPFGEYIPAPQIFGGIYRFLNMPLMGLSRGEEVQPPFSMAGGKVAANICYEDAFGNEIRRNAVNATLLVNLTNMGWFDGSWAAEQHAEMARARALENGRYLIRATNTGKTAIINHKGQLIAALPPEQRGVLEGEITHRTGTTPYQIWGDTPIVALWFAVLIALFAANYRTRLVSNRAD